MASEAKVLSLKVRARRASDHAFNVSGIIEWDNPTLAQLGARVATFDPRTEIYARLSAPEVVGGHETGRLLYDADRIRQEMLRHATHALANEVMAAELNQTILRRQTEFVTRYAFANEAQALSDQTLTAKADALRRLTGLVEQHFNMLDQAYGSGGVTTPKVTMATRIAGLGSIQHSTSRTFEGGAEKQAHVQDSTNAVARFDGSNWVEVRDPAAVALSQETISVSENDELRHPKLENSIRHARACADLLDETLQASLLRLGATNLALAWRNRLADLDLEVRKLQVQYIDSFLLPRMSGRVTAVAKRAGENVRAGEMVVRIEDDSLVQLTGQIRCAEAIQVGQRCRVTTDNVFGALQPVPLTLPGNIVSIRGYDSERDRWNVVIECQQGGSVSLPLGYEFEANAGATTLEVG